jgi:hypothetical protein
MSRAAPKNLSDRTGLFVRDGDRKIYLTNPEKWSHSNGGDLVIARVGSWGPTWTATWRADSDKGEATNSVIQWLMDNTKSAPMVGRKNQESCIEDGLLFRAALCTSVRDFIATEGGLSSRATDEYIAQYNACAPTTSEYPDDEKGHYVKEGISKIYLTGEINPSHELWLFKFGPTGKCCVAAASITREDALEEAADWLTSNEPKYAPKGDLLTKDRARLRSFMRREGMKGSFDDLSGNDQDTILERLAKDYVECHSGYFPKRHVREKHLKTGTLKRKLLGLSDHIENHGEEDVDDTEALAALYGQSSVKRRSAPRRSSKPASKKRGPKRRVTPKSPPKKRKLRGVTRRSD